MVPERPVELLARSMTFLVVGMLIFALTIPRLFTVVECGGEWPVCAGSILPQTTDLALFLGWFARLFTVLLSALGVTLIGISIFAFRRQLMNLQELSSLAALLILLQAAGSLLIVILGLNLHWVIAHMLASILIALVFVFSGLWSTYVTDERLFRPYFVAFSYFVTIVAFAVSFLANLAGL
jgi:heme A synthase